MKSSTCKQLCATDTVKVVVIEKNGMLVAEVTGAGRPTARITLGPVEDPAEPAEMRPRMSR